MAEGGNYERIYRTVKKIPIGFVATYGDVAKAAGLPGHARQVGYALASLKDDSIPWQRVVNAKGEISLRTSGIDGESRQQAMLEAEGIRFDDNGRIDLKTRRYEFP